MKMYYVTLNNSDEASQISLVLLEKQLAVCTNMFSIACAYRWQGEIKQENEIVLIIKTKEGMRVEIEKVIRSYINYTNFIGEINVETVNDNFLQWLDAEVKY